MTNPSIRVGYMEPKDVWLSYCRGREEEKKKHSHEVSSRTKDLPIISIKEPYILLN